MWAFRTGFAHLAVGVGAPFPWVASFFCHQPVSPRLGGPPFCPFTNEGRLGCPQGFAGTNKAAVSIFSGTERLGVLVILSARVSLAEEAPGG